MKPLLQMGSVKVLVRGGGDLASGVAWRLHQSRFRVVITEIPEPLAVRRKVAFCEAVYDGQAVVEGVKAVLVGGPEQVANQWRYDRYADGTVCKIGLLCVASTDTNSDGNNEFEESYSYNGALQVNNINTKINYGGLTNKNYLRQFSWK